MQTCTGGGAVDGGKTTGAGGVTAGAAAGADAAGGAHLCDSVSVAYSTVMVGCSQ